MLAEVMQQYENLSTSGLLDNLETHFKKQCKQTERQVSHSVFLRNEYP